MPARLMKKGSPGKRIAVSTILAIVVLVLLLCVVLFINEEKERYIN